MLATHARGGEGGGVNKAVFSHVINCASSVYFISLWVFMQHAKTNEWESRTTIWHRVKDLELLY